MRVDTVVVVVDGYDDISDTAESALCFRFCFVPFSIPIPCSAVTVCFIRLLFAGGNVT